MTSAIFISPNSTSASRSNKLSPDPPTPATHADDNSQKSLSIFGPDGPFHLKGQFDHDLKFRSASPSDSETVQRAFITQLQASTHPSDMRRFVMIFDDGPHGKRDVEYRAMNQHEFTALTTELSFGKHRSFDRRQDTFAGRAWLSGWKGTAWMLMSPDATSANTYPTIDHDRGIHQKLRECNTERISDLSKSLINPSHSASAKVEADDLAFQLIVDGVATRCIETDTNRRPREAVNPLQETFQPPQSVCLFGGKGTGKELLVRTDLSASEYVEEATEWETLYGKESGSGAPIGTLSYRPVRSTIEGHEGLRALIGETCTELIELNAAERLNDGEHHTTEEHARVRGDVLDELLTLYTSEVKRLFDAEDKEAAAALEEQRAKPVIFG